MTLDSENVVVVRPASRNIIFAIILTDCVTFPYDSQFDQTKNLLEFESLALKKMDHLGHCTYSWV